jgi:hypothetical protein
MIDRLLFEQGGRCFFCLEPLNVADASVEHLLASANGGRNGNDNCVACCKSLNALLGHKSLKEKFQVVLNQRGAFRCPNGKPKTHPVNASPTQAIERVIEDLRKRSKARPASIAKLSSTINNLFQRRLSAEQLCALVEELRSRGVVQIEGTKVKYVLPAVGA